MAPDGLTNAQAEKELRRLVAQTLATPAPETVIVEAGGLPGTWPG